MALLLAVSVTPIHTLGMHYLLTVHLLQNVVLAEWAPLLVVLGIPPALAASIARHAPVRALTHPAVALPLWLANYMVWHLPWIYDAALENPNGLLHLEHAHVLRHRGRDVVVRLPGRAAPPRARARGRPTSSRDSSLASPIGLVMALVPDAIYDFYVDAHHRVWGLDPLEDQQLAGMLMAVEQAVVFFAVFALLVLPLPAEEERREDVDRPSVAA